MDTQVSGLYHTGHLLRRAQQLHAALWNREVSRFISSVQFAALTVLDRRPGIGQVDLGAELDLDRSTIADLTDRMVRNGLVAREQSTADRRRKILGLTHEGVDTLARLRPAVDRVEQLLTAKLDHPERVALQLTLLTILEHGVEHGVLQHIATPTWTPNSQGDARQ